MVASPPDSSTPRELLPLVRLASGGQTGADRAALDVARKFDFPSGGWCPQGRLAEDGPLPATYRLVESPSARYLQRTEWNARDSDGTVLLTLQEKLTGGSKRTAEFARKHGKPCLHLHPACSDPPGQLLAFLREHRIRHLNVAGSRASREPGLYEWACAVLEQALFPAEPDRLVGTALTYLGPDFVLTGALDNAHAPRAYGETRTPHCWRFYYQPLDQPALALSGPQPYLLVEKKTAHILGTGLESGE